MKPIKVSTFFNQTLVGNAIATLTRKWPLRPSGRRSSGPAAPSRFSTTGFPGTLRQSLIACLALATITPMFSAAGGLDEPLVWRWSNPRPHGNNIIGLAQLDGLVAQVTERGRIYTSTDLDQWIPRRSHTDRALRSAVFFQGRLVAVGEEGTVLVADSLDDIQRLDLATGDWLEGLAASPDLLVAVGDRGAVYTSPDGLNWNRRPQGFNQWLRSVAYGGGTFVAVGEEGFMATSADGVNWTERNSGISSHLNQVEWIENQFVAVGDAGAVLSSGNGISWQPMHSGATGDLQTASGEGSTLLVAGVDEVRLRERVSWSDQTSPLTTSFPAPKWSYLSGIWEGSLYLLAGRTGLILEGFRTNSVSPMVWVDRHESLRNWLWDIHRTEEFYIAVGDRATVMTSEDGIHWELELVPETLVDSIFLGVGGSEELFLTVGNKGSAMLSENGVIWEAVSMPTVNDLQGVAFGHGQFVVTGGEGTILTSPNGTDWTSRTSGVGTFLSSVTPHPGGWVAAGNNGAILTSPDGAAWTARVSGTSDWIYRVRYVGGQLIATGQNGTILTSPDGMNWTARSSGTARWLNDVTHLDGAYYVAGTGGTVLASSNAIDWMNIGTITGKALFGLARSGGQLVAVGIEGTVLRTQVVPDPSPISIVDYSHQGGENLFLFSGKPDQRFRLNRSRDLKAWQPGPELEFLDGETAFIHRENIPGEPSHFFRISR